MCWACCLVSRLFRLIACLSVVGFEFVELVGWIWLVTWLLCVLSVVFCICCGSVIWRLGGFVDSVILLWFVGLCLVFWI